MINGTSIMNEEQLVKACLDGNNAAQRQFYEQYARRMMGLCLRYAVNTEEAEDFLQDGFIKVFEKMHSFEFRGSLAGWVRRIVLNTILDRLRRDIHLKDNVSLDNHLEVAGNDNPYQHLGAKELIKLVQSLPTGYRTVFNLFAVEGYSHKEIAQSLNISESTSKSQYLRAKEQLQKKLISERSV
ncbi:MAG: sigma-70 family RNA polymerase sigma factor [Bacteroidia bacterium]